MNFLHKIQRKRNIKRLAYLNQKIEYCHETIDATQKCINNLEIGLKRVLSHPSPVFVVCYSSDYTNPIEKHLEKLSCARAELKYWESLKCELIALMEEK